ncbi:cyclin-dependent kinase inhibitor 1B-like [Oryzias latipes]|uniref:Cyclin-dependent kinase inhibitor 1B n=1 Tax=Oryzias latipes TaxID=8090 RepID=A0A3B3ILI5_ORYLA
MSDVRLSSGSPTVERVEARQQDSVRQVRRTLFGTPDPEETRRFLAEITQEGAQDFAQRYNFDPLTERPLPPGNYEWQKDDDAPEFYRRPPHGCRRPRWDDGGSSQEDEGRTGTRSPAPSLRRSGSRKRRADTSDSCSKPCPNKRSRPDGDDPEDQSDGARSLALSVGPSEADSAEDVH